MNQELIKKYVKDLDGLLNKVEEIGDDFLSWKAFPKEKMVVYLFGRLFEFFIFSSILVGEESDGSFGGLDALAWDIDGNDFVIEFEAFSNQFKVHGHPPDKCDLIICWKHNWRDCPNHIDVIELRQFWEMKKK